MAKTVLQAVMAALHAHGELYGVSLRHDVSERLGRDVAIGEIYAACDVLEKGGVVISREGEATAERGWRKKRYFKFAEHADA